MFPKLREHVMLLCVFLEGANSMDSIITIEYLKSIGVIELNKLISTNLGWKEVIQDLTPGSINLGSYPPSPSSVRARKQEHFTDLVVERWAV